ncbi:hypothetical protein FACS189437_06590 [Bacteroidia bacterium]|nr:hypothetical protein FACS189437_06590 [Bacteroidia bacterium]
MKKMMLLMLTLLIWSAASMNAQVKIGGDGTTGPVAGAVLELDGADGALLLPRVDALPPIISSTAGMQVYLKSDNQVYIYDGTKWNVYAGPAGQQGAPGASVDVSAVPGTVKSVKLVYGTGTAAKDGQIDLEPGVTRNPSKTILIPCSTLPAGTYLRWWTTYPGIWGNAAGAKVTYCVTFVDLN